MIRAICFLLVFLTVSGTPPDSHCKFSLGAYKFDLRPLYRSDAERDYYGHDDEFVYHMNVCGPAHIGGKCSLRNGTLCQYKKFVYNDSKNVTGAFMASIAGTNEIPVWELLDPKDAQKGVKATYAKSGDTCNIRGKKVPRAAQISFYCQHEQFPNPSFLIHEDSGTCIYKVSLNTPEACPKSDLPPPITAGSTYSRSIMQKSWHYDSIVVTENTAELLVKLVQTGSNSSAYGDPDLYLRKGALPTTTSYDFRASISGADEQLSVLASDKDKPLTAEKYVIGVYAYGNHAVNFDLQAFLFKCPGNCSNHGTCGADGVCACDEGYNVDSNDDCSAQVQDVTLGQTVNGDFHQHDSATYFRFDVTDNATFQLQVNVDWNNTDVTAILAVAKGRFPTVGDNDGRDASWYGGVGELQVELDSDSVSMGTWIAGIFKRTKDLTTVSSFSFTANTFDCPSDCSGHGTCDPTTHSCVCNDGYTGKSDELVDCSVETKPLTEQASVETSVPGYEKMYFVVDVPADQQSELIVSVVCKNNGSEPQVFLSKGKLPTYYIHEFSSALPRSTNAIIAVSPYNLKSGRYYLMVPNYRRAKIDVSVSIKFRTTKCTPAGGGSSGGGDDEPTGTGGYSAGTVVGWSILFMGIGIAIGWFGQSKRGGNARRHRMIDDGINSDGSYDPPMVDNSIN